MENTWRNTSQSRGVALCPPTFWQRHIGSISMTQWNRSWVFRKFCRFAHKVWPETGCQNLLKSHGFSRCFSLQWAAHKDHPQTGVDWAQGGPFLPEVVVWGILFLTHHRLWWQKNTYVWHMSPRCSTFFRRHKSIEPYYWSHFACRNPSMSQGPWPFPALSTQDRDSNISYREFVPFAFDLLQKMASSGAPRAMEELTSGWMLMVRINILYHNTPRLVKYYNLPRWLISSLIMNSLTMLHSIQ